METFAEEKAIFSQYLTGTYTKHLETLNALIISDTEQQWHGGSVVGVDCPPIIMKVGKAVGEGFPALGIINPEDPFVVILRLPENTVVQDHMATINDHLSYIAMIIRSELRRNKDTFNTIYQMWDGHKVVGNYWIQKMPMVSEIPSFYSCITPKNDKLVKSLRRKPPSEKALKKIQAPKVSWFYDWTTRQ